MDECKALVLGDTAEEYFCPVVRKAGAYTRSLFSST